MSALEDLQRLEEALASGNKVVRYQDKLVEYQTTRDMLEYRKILLAKIQPTGKIKLAACRPYYDGGFNS